MNEEAVAGKRAKDHDGRRRSRPTLGSDIESSLLWERDPACANREKSLLCPVFFGGSSTPRRRQRFNPKQP
jgi:hypothetical protein